VVVVVVVRKEPATHDVFGRAKIKDNIRKQELWESSLLGWRSPMETRTVKPRNQLPNIVRPSMPRRVSTDGLF
jgi:hypothetical protein